MYHSLPSSFVYGLDRTNFEFDFTHDKIELFWLIQGPVRANHGEVLDEKDTTFEAAHPVD
jgi:hypothetical protein